MLSDYIYVGKTLQLKGDIVVFESPLGQGGGAATVWHVVRTSTMRITTHEAFKFYIHRREEQSSLHVKEALQQLTHIEAKTWQKFAQNSEYVIQKTGDVQELINDPQHGDLVITGFYMELAIHGDLRQFKDDHPEYFNEKKNVRGLLMNIASAILSGHSVDVVHCDIKPHNVVIFNRGTRFIAKVMDFGTSFDPNASTNVIGGTPKYMAPELVNEPGRSPSKQSDIYSLGLLFYEAWIDSLPASAFDEYFVHNETDSGLLKIAQRSSGRMASLIRRMLALDPTKRPNIEKVLSELQSQSDESVAGEYRRNDQNTILTRDRYRWTPETHFALGHTLVYCFLAPPGSIDASRLKEDLESKGIYGFSITRVLGGYDFLLRAWVNDDGLLALSRFVEELPSGTSGKSSMFRVSHFVLWYARKTSTMLTTDMIDTVILSASKQIMEPERLSELKKAKLVHSVLTDLTSDSVSGLSTTQSRVKKNGVRFFVVLKSSQTLPLPQAIAIANLLDLHLRGVGAIKDLSIYTGVGSGSGMGSWFGLIKFRLIDFFAFAIVIDMINLQLKEWQPGTVFYSQTFVEFDRIPYVESDDGPLLHDAKDRLRSKS